jgi:hypothetical protein
MGEAQGFAAIDDMIRRVRGLPDAFDEAAPEIARMAKRETDRAIDESHSLDGKPWKPTKAGTKPLAYAAKAVRTYVDGQWVIIELSGYEVFHNYGTKRVPARPILPSVDGMPLKLGIAIRKGIVKIGSAHLGGGGRR